MAVKPETTQEETIKKFTVTVSGAEQRLIAQSVDEYASLLLAGAYKTLGDGNVEATQNMVEIVGWLITLRIKFAPDMPVITEFDTAGAAEVYLSTLIARGFSRPTG